jgi:hypothetical protein
VVAQKEEEAALGRHGEEEEGRVGRLADWAESEGKILF